MAISITRVELNGFVVRFFSQRRDAIGEANALTVINDWQHNAKHCIHGWVVQQAKPKDEPRNTYDYSGLVPPEALVGLKFR